MKQETKQPEKAYAAGTPSYQTKDSATPLANRQYDAASPKGTPPLDDIVDQTRYHVPQPRPIQGEMTMMDLLAGAIMQTYMQMGNAYKAMASFYQKAEQMLDRQYRAPGTGKPAYAAPGYATTKK